MNLTKRTVLGALLTSLAAPSALAEGRQIEEVIVTAERQEASIQDTSISITAFTGEFIDDFAGKGGNRNGSILNGRLYRRIH